MKLSIITINLNNSYRLSKTIESVVDQTFKDYEYIIIDGGSTDGSVDLIKEYADKITYWVSEPDKGIYYAMNKGILAAKGDWIGIINSGDWYEKDALENINSAISASSDAQIIHGVLRFWEGDKISKIQGRHSSFLPQGMIEHPATFVKNEVYQSFGLFDVTYKISSDYEFMIRLYTKNARFLFIDKILANFTVGGISDTSPLKALETKSIRQQYRLASAETRRSKLSSIYYAFRQLIGLLIPVKVRTYLKDFSIFLL